MAFLVDSHAHLWDKRFHPDRKQILDGFAQQDMLCIVEVGVNLETSRESVRLAYSHERVFAAVGTHPHDAAGMTEEHLEQIHSLCRMDRCVAIGEIGLDFYRNLSPQPIQKQWFVRQLQLAIAQDLPVILHVRDAYPQVLEILRQEGIPRAGGVVHSFFADRATARSFLELGMHLGISGPVTFPKNPQLRELVAFVPLERLLSETDCPYLTPHPHRGKRNEPAFVRLVVETIAEQKKLPFETVANRLSQNALSLFSIPLDSVSVDPIGGEIS
ncbi:MAG TPA: TatD family hydrolase [Thermotogota bacterium]|nr:TatD family hydrolase [Thermotogota bacterium]